MTFKCFILVSVLFINSECESSPKNIILLSVDTLRADHLGCYGYPIPTSPNIDNIAKKGLIFDNCIAEVPLTCPSLSSMLTSQYPRSIGVTRNGLGISNKTKTILEIFKEHGYHTFCIQSNWTLKDKLSNLKKGFDIYDDDFHSKRWGIFSSERTADEVTKRAIHTINKRPKDKPFFAWIHYSDPHAPYRFRKEYNPYSEIRNNTPKIKKVIKSYDSEIKFTDDQIGILLKHIPPNTSILFVADHGESLYEHNYLGHGRKLYQNEIRIPLFIVDEKIIPGRSLTPVRGVDIGPTLLGLANIKKTPDMGGKDIINESIPNDRIRVIETYGGAVPKMPILHFLMKKAGPIMQAVILNDWKLIINKEKAELYNLTLDPNENNNITIKNKEKVKELIKIIKDWSVETPIENSKNKNKISKEDIEILKSMGYLE